MEPIGIIDSGVGGLTIWREIKNQLPHESTIYLGDSKNCPYGIKPPEEIYHLAKRLVQFLIQKDVKLIVIACNTITVTCLQQLRTDFLELPIVGTVPVVKMAAKLSKKKIIGILSTLQTAHSVYQRDLIETFAKDCTVINLGTDKLVPLVEAGTIEGETVRQVLIEVLRPFQDAGIDTLALGCTHYPFLQKEMQQILGPDVQILDSAGAIARQVGRILQAEQKGANEQIPNHLICTTGEPERVRTILAEAKTQVQQVLL